MHTTHIWHKFHLHGKKVIIAITFILLTVSSVWAQNRSSFGMNLRDYEDKKLRYGFLIGVNMSRFQSLTSEQYLEFDNLLIQNSVSPGFSLGLVGSYRFANRWVLRLSPTAGFNERKIVYKNVRTEETVEQIVEATEISFPLMLKFESNRRKNSKMYMVAGVAPSFSLSSKKEENQEIIRNTPNSFAIEYGFGLENFFSMFKLGAELRFSHGLKNVLEFDNTFYANQLNELTKHSVSLYLFFE